ncbi:MAG: hypothetical protein K1Y36_11050 [Blastocatellia bacterium]|nr:hypothetical protein [Blastocatellia bacterium]
MSKLFFGLVFMLYLIGTNPLTSLGHEAVAPLKLNAPIEREISEKQTHIYSLELQAKQIPSLRLKKNGVDLAITVSLPDGKPLFALDSPHGSYGEAQTTFLAPQTGIYRVELHPLSLNKANGHYALRLDSFLSESEYVTAHLAELGRLWGAVKFFHPHLAYKNIDWDDALIKAIPEVKAARNPQEFKQALGRLLQKLDDPLTRVLVAPDVEPSFPTQETSETTPALYRTVNENLIVNLPALADLFQKRTLTAEHRTAIAAEIAKSKGVILDCRFSPVPNPQNLQYSFPEIIKSIIPLFVKGEIPLGTIRCRSYEGYPPQVGTGFEGYGASFTTKESGTVMGKAEKPLPVTVLIDGQTPDIFPVLSGLQATGAKILEVGTKMGESENSSHSFLLMDGIWANVRISERVTPSGSLNFQPEGFLPAQESSDETIVAFAQKALNQTPPQSALPTASPLPPARNLKDRAYETMTFPDENYRLLALFRFWNATNYFFPYKHLVESPWKTVLTEFIPRFMANQNQIEYQRTLAELSTRLQDSHSVVYPMKALDDHLGEFAPELILRRAGGKVLIEAIKDPQIGQTTGIEPGDLVLAVDGVPVEVKFATPLKPRAASTPQAAYWNEHFNLLRGTKDSRVRLKLAGKNGQTREVELVRTTPASQAMVPQPRQTPVFQVLPSGYGYLDLDRLTRDEVEPARTAIMETSGLILDLRGYPHINYTELSSWLSRKKGVPFAQISRPLQTGLFFSDEFYQVDTPGLTYFQKTPNRTDRIYQGKVVVLINENAISAAEHLCLFLEAATDVTFIGSPTSGADGNVTNLVVPGGIVMMFSGMEVRHGDGRQLQRVGIQPHIKVEPTPEGIRAGRDEVLEAAVKHLDSLLKKQRK